MKLSNGWDSGLKEIDGEMARVVADISFLIAERDARIEQIRREYDKKIPSDSMEALKKRREEEWTRIRGEYDIRHPAIRECIADRREAAKVIAEYHHIVENGISKERLIEQINSGMDRALCTRAYDSAVNLTEPSSKERRYVKKAGKLLFGGSLNEILTA